MSGIVQDFRFAMRSARRYPLLFTVATAVMALAIAASTAVFSVVDAVLLRPLPFKEPERLVLAWERSPEIGVPFMEVSYPNFLEWQSQSRKLEALADMATTNSGFIVAGDEPMDVPGRLVSGNFFDVLGARALLGRTLTLQDNRPGAALVAVVSHGLWHRLFGADPGVVGRTVVVNGKPTTVIGVMPPDFRYPPQAELWIPMVPSEPEAVANRGMNWTVVVGRLANGANATEAGAELDVIIARIWAAIRAAHKEVSEPEHTAVVTPFKEHLFGPARNALLVLLGAVLLVLLIACANVCALLLARASARQREIAVRLALGASRGRLARQLLAESALIAGAGGLVGLLLTVWTLRTLVALVPAEVPRLQDVAVDGRVLAFAITLTALSTLVAGLTPALMASKPSLTEALTETARLAGDPSHHRLRGLLVAGEVAIALVLLSGAGLLAQTFSNLRSVELGFEPRHLLAVGLSGSSQGYERQQDLYTALLERITVLPGVEAAGAAGTRPLRDKVGNAWPFEAEGQSQDQIRLNPLVNLEDVTPGYFEAMRIRLLRGRTFTERDDQRLPGVVVVSRTMAERCWPGQDAIGKRLKIPLPDTPYDGSLTGPGGEGVWLTVVGVVGEARYRELQAPRFDMYMSYLQTNHGLSHIMVRTTGDPAAVAPSVRAAIHSVDRNLVVGHIETMDAIVTAALGGARFGMQLLSVFALGALLLAAVGTYGVMAFVVGRRTREVGIRMALGAQAASVMAMVVRQGMAPVVAGLAVGLAGSLALGRALSSLLYGVPAHDPGTLAAASAVLAGTALVACVMPARRAAHIDPARALREQ
jgi:putative ABC transport system permease protein